MGAETELSLFSPETADLICIKGNSAARDRLEASRSPREIAVLDRMFRDVEFGHHELTNYQYPVFVLPGGTIFSCEESAIGLREVYAKVCLLGDHAKNGIGTYIPSEQAWNEQKEPETAAYLRVHAFGENPKIKTSVVMPNSPEWRQVDNRYHDFLENREKADRVDAIYRRVGTYRDEQAKKKIIEFPVPSPSKAIASAAAD